MVPPLEESEDGNRASFSRWEKRSVISNHFTELNLEITEMGMLPSEDGAPGETRTPDPLLRRQLLYPTELLARLYWAC